MRQRGGLLDRRVKLNGPVRTFGWNVALRGSILKSRHTHETGFIGAD